MDWAAEAAKFGGTVAAPQKNWAAEAAKFGGSVVADATPAQNPGIPDSPPKQAPQPEPDYSLMDRVKGAGEAGLAVAGDVGRMVAGAPGYVAGTIGGMAGNVASGTYGTPRGLRGVEDVAAEGAAKTAGGVGYTPKTPLGQKYYQNILDVVDASKISGMGPNEALSLGAAKVPQGTMTAIKTAVQPEIQAVKAGAAKVADVVAKAGVVPQAVAGFTTGAGREAFAQAYKAGKTGDATFAANMRGNVPVEQVLTDAKQGISKMGDDMSAAYRDAKDGWAADKTTLDFEPIDKAFAKLEASTSQGGHSMIGKDELKKIDEVRSVLDEWRADPSVHTTLGLDALKRRLDAIYPDNFSQKQAQRVIAGTRAAVKDAIVTQAPDYADAMSAYENRIGTIQDIEKALSLGTRAAKDTAIKKLQSLSRNNANTNYGYRKDMADTLKDESGVDVMPAISGQALSSVLPRGLASMGPMGEGAAALAGHPAALAALPLASPRLMGEVFHGAGKVAALKDRLLGNGVADAVGKDLTLAPAGAEIPTTTSPFTPKAPQPSPLMSLADEPPKSAPAVEAPSVDKPLHQEIFRQREVTQAINSFQAETEQLQKLLASDVAKPLKDAATIRLKVLQEEFAAKMNGLRSGFYGEGYTKLPVEHGFSGGIGMANPADAPHGKPYQPKKQTPIEQQSKTGFRVKVLSHDENGRVSELMIVPHEGETLQ